MSPTRLLRSAREAAHLSQAEVAAALGVTVKTVQRWEAGEPASERHRAAVAAFLERLEVRASGRRLATVPAPLQVEARRVHDEVLALADKMIHSGERVPPGWRWNIYALVSFLRRASSSTSLIFAEEAETLIAEQGLLAEWRKATIGVDEYAGFRARVVSVLRRIHTASPARAAGWSGLATGVLALILGRILAELASGRPDSNRRPTRWQRVVLPTELLPRALSVPG